MFHGACFTGQIFNVLQGGRNNCVVSYQEYDGMGVLEDEPFRHHRHIIRHA